MAATVNMGPGPSSCPCTAVASVLAMTSGMKDRALNSNKSSSMARITPAIGVLKVADIPAAAPLASSTLRSDAVVWSSCPISANSQFNLHHFVLVILPDQTVAPHNVKEKDIISKELFTSY